MLHTVFAALQSSAIVSIWQMKMKELHCGLFSGKLINAATPFLLITKLMQVL